MGELLNFESIREQDLAKKAVRSIQIADEVMLKLFELTPHPKHELPAETILQLHKAISFVAYARLLK